MKCTHEVPKTKCPEGAFALPFICLMMSHHGFMVEHPRLNGGKASDWLRQSRQLELQIHPKPFATFSERYLFRALQLCSPHSFHNWRECWGEGSL